MPLLLPDDPPADPAASSATAPATKAAPSESGDIARVEKSQFEKELEATIQENPVVSWLREHPLAYHGSAAGITFVVALVLYVALRAVVFLPIMRFLERRSQGEARSTHLVRAIRDSRMINALAWVLPFAVAWRGIYLWPGLLPFFAETYGRMMLGIAIIFGLLAFGRSLAAVDLLVSMRLKRPDALRGYVQAITAVVMVVGGITIIAILLGRSPIYFLTGVGAFAALLAVVLKDTLLSMYANILMTTGDTLRVGDWIEFRQYGLDGRVERISLTSTKVRNWDETTLTVPNYRFVSEIFINYRTQNPKGGRRLKRSIRIDQRSVRELAPEELDAAARIKELAPAVNLARAAAVLAAAGGPVFVTNLSLYRAYLEWFLGSHPVIDRTRPVVVRQNEPSGTGLAVDVLCVFLDRELREYETLQASMLDHFLAATTVFGLRVYQMGSDLAAVREPFAFLPEESTRLLRSPA